MGNRRKGETNLHFASRQFSSAGKLTLRVGVECFDAEGRKWRRWRGLHPRLTFRSQRELDGFLGRMMAFAAEEWDKREPYAIIENGHAVMKPMPPRPKWMDT